jgi:hypothetical protein
MMLLFYLAMEIRMCCAKSTLQIVSILHGLAQVDQSLTLILLFYLARAILDGTNLGSSARKYPPEYIPVLLTRTKAFH